MLGEDYLDIKVVHLALEDNMLDNCSAKASLSNGVVVTGSGVGLVDALFNAFKVHYVNEYSSLASIELLDFNVRLSRAARKRQDGIDAVCEVQLEVRNSRRRRFDFSSASRSLTTSTATAVAAVVELFVNSERAYIALQRALEDAKGRNRQDLVGKYTCELSEVVRQTG